MNSATRIPDQNYTRNRVFRNSTWKTVRRFENVSTIVLHDILIISCLSLVRNEVIMKSLQRYSV